MLLSADLDPWIHCPDSDGGVWHTTSFLWSASRSSFRRRKRSIRSDLHLLDLSFATRTLDEILPAGQDLPNGRNAFCSPSDSWIGCSSPCLPTHSLHTGSVILSPQMTTCLCGTSISSSPSPNPSSSPFLRPGSGPACPLCVPGAERVCWHKGEVPLEECTSNDVGCKQYAKGDAYDLPQHVDPNPPRRIRTQIQHQIQQDRDDYSTQAQPRVRYSRTGIPLPLRCRALGLVYSRPPHRRPVSRRSHRRMDVSGCV